MRPEPYEDGHAEERHSQVRVGVAGHMGEPDVVVVVAESLWRQEQRHCVDGPNAVREEAEVRLAGVVEMGHHAEVVAAAAGCAVLQQYARVSFQNSVVYRVEHFVMPPGLVFVSASHRIFPAVTVERVVVQLIIV